MISYCKKFEKKCSSGETSMVGLASFSTSIELDPPPATPSPTSSHSSFPTASPTTLSPTSSPTSHVRCPKDTRLLKIKGVTEYPSGDTDTAGAVNIISQDKSTVTVELVQAWDGPIEKLFYAYKVDLFQKTCKEEDGVQVGTTIDTITLQCKATVPVAHLTICLQDMNGNLLDAGDKATVSKCCHSDAPEGTPTVCYDLEIACETTCGSDGESVNQRSRNLRSK